MSQEKSRPAAPRQTSTVLDAWLRSRRGPGDETFALRPGERLHEARVYPGRIEGYRLELLSKAGDGGITLVATLLRPDATVSFQRRWERLDEQRYAAAVEEVEREVGRLGLCDPEAVQVLRPETDAPNAGHPA